MLIANIYGRIGADPVARTTKAGNAMTTCSVAVDVTAKDAEPTTLWVSILAFGGAAEDLLGARKGQMMAAMGRLSRGQYTTAAGEVRENWTLLADSVVSAASAKPSSHKAGNTQSRPPDRQRAASRRFQEPAPFDDPIGF